MKEATYFFEALSEPAQKALSNAGYVHLEQFSKLTKKHLLQLHGVGPKTIRQLSEFLAAKGMSFAKE